MSHLISKHTLRFKETNEAIVLMLPKDSQILHIKINEFTGLPDLFIMHEVKNSSVLEPKYFELFKTDEVINYDLSSSLKYIGSFTLHNTLNKSVAHIFQRL